MRNLNGKKIKHASATALACTAAVIGLVCLFQRIPVLLGGSEDLLTTLAAGLTLPDGAKTVLMDGYGASSAETSSQPEAPAASSAAPVSSNAASSSTGSSAAPAISSGVSSYPPLSSEGFEIIESQFGASGIQFGNFFVKNTTSVDIDIGAELEKRPDINISKNGEPQVLIMHTHTTEGYLPEDYGYYPEDFSPRSTDNNYNVTRVGEAIAQKLEAAGIGVIHDMTVHDNPSYNGSYYRAEDTIKADLEAHPSIQVVLDIHRDAIGNAESGKVKPTFVANGKKAAQIMIVAGCDDDGTWEFPDWEYNLRFALRMQQTAESMYPGMTRPMQFCASQYNMHLTHGSLLIEVGTDANTMEEATYTGSLLGDVLTNVLNNLTGE